MNNIYLNQSVKKIQTLLNERIKEEKLKRRENLRGGSYWSDFDYCALIPAAGYIIKELPNNRPLTLLKEKADAHNSFVCFLNYKTFNDGNPCFAFFNIDEYKRTIEAVGVPHIGCCYKDARKDEGRLFIIYNKNWIEWLSPLCKHNQRIENHHYNKLNINTRFYKYNFDVIKWRYDSNIRYNLTLESLDKSGYCVEYARKIMKQRAATLKAERDQKKAEENKQNFINSDKSELLSLLSSHIKDKKAELVRFLNINTIFEPLAIKVITIYKESINKLTKIKNNINDYARYKEPYLEIKADVKKSLDNVIIVLTQFNNNNINWCDPDCYILSDDNKTVLPRWDWVKEKYYRNNIAVNTQRGF